MRKMIYFCQLIVIGAMTWSTAVSTKLYGAKKSEFHLMLENNWPDPDPNINRFPHQTSCHYFYLVLSEEDVSIQKCPDGELFDYFVHKCVEKKSARCWSRHFSQIKHNHNLLHKAPKKFKCPYSYGKFPDTTDCTKYYQCLSGKAKIKKCAPFEYFDKIERKCMAEIEAVCADETDAVERGYKCPRFQGSFSFSKDCSKYYECIDKRPDLRTCSKHTLFDEKKRKCISNESVHCGLRHNPYERETTSISIQEQTEEITGHPKDTSQTMSDSSNEPLFSTSDVIKFSIAVSKSDEKDNTASKEVSDVPTKGYDSSENDISKESKEPSEDRNKDNSKETKEDSNESNSKESNEDPDLGSSIIIEEFITTVKIAPTDENSSKQETVTESNRPSSTVIYESTKDGKMCHPKDSTCIQEKDWVIRCPAANGMFPYPEDETRFLHCSNFKIHVRKCPKKLIFKESSQACTWPLKMVQKNA